MRIGICQPLARCSKSFKARFASTESSNVVPSSIPTEMLSGGGQSSKRGITEELYCAMDSKNADMCQGLSMSAADHVESFVRASSHCIVFARLLVTYTI